MADVIWLGSEACNRAEVVGAKAANLSRLASEFRVPPGFVLANLSTDSSALPPDLVETVRDAYRRLGALSGDPVPSVAVRSSALDEDGVASSFAGQHATFLNVRGESEVLAAVERCIASGSSTAALSYRAARELSLIEGIRMAVLVQQLVRSEQSAVAFSAHPVTGARDEVVINASWGLGESVVSGLVTPDLFVVNGHDFAIDTRVISDKQVMTVATSDGTEQAAVRDPMRRVPCLDDAQVVAIARLACELETRMGWPVDIECAFSDDELYLLQCRPITTLRS